MTFKKFSKFPHPSIKVVSFAAIKHLSLDAYLTDSEQRELWMKKPARRPGWLASRFAAKQLVRELISDMVMTDFAIEHKALGTPHVVAYGHYLDLTHLAISLSHTKSYGAAVAGAVAAGPVGIDIEYIRQFADATLRAFLTAAEYQTVHQEPPAKQAQLATVYWSCKEAYLKAHGVGLRVHPQTVPVALTRATTMQFDNHVVAAVSLGNDRGEKGTKFARITGAADYRGRGEHTPRENYVAV